MKLENFAGTCGFEADGSLSPLGAAGAGAERLRAHLEGMLSLQDREARHYLHLIDGGIADNLGLRAAYDQVGLLGPDVEASFARAGHRDVRLILVMSVSPGFGGQAFMPEVLEKVRTLRGLLSPQQRLEIDGGIDPETIGAAVKAGADTLVAGSAVFGEPDPAAAMARLRHAATEATGAKGTV